VIRDRPAWPTVAVWRVVLCGALFVLATACQWAAPQRNPLDTAGPTSQYLPLYRPSGAARESRGTLRGDFQWAADAPTLDEAAVRWRSFLGAHDPPGQEFEDGVHASYVTAAQYELLRVYYLMGRREEGDALLRGLDPPGWEP